MDAQRAGVPCCSPKCSAGGGCAGGRPQWAAAGRYPCAPRLPRHCVGRGGKLHDGLPAGALHINPPSAHPLQRLQKHEHHSLHHVHHMQGRCGAAHRPCPARPAGCRAERAWTRLGPHPGGAAPRAHCRRGGVISGPHRRVPEPPGRHPYLPCGGLPRCAPSGSRLQPLPWLNNRGMFQHVCGPCWHRCGTQSADTTKSTKQLHIWFFCDCTGLTGASVGWPCPHRLGRPARLLVRQIPAPHRRAATVHLAGGASQLAGCAGECRAGPCSGQGCDRTTPCPADKPPFPGRMECSREGPPHAGPGCNGHPRRVALAHGHCGRERVDPVRPRGRHRSRHVE
mmetsp:Transcript_47280/g.119070  ORF Transcript_47280/g.119070 Transcript_47280/m.119070 type:complete len:339 (+) Transcript_47280:1192-2208(+)